MHHGVTIQTIDNTITAVAAAGGVVVAILGLGAWREQLKGKMDYELARRYLRATYKIRDALKFVRNPFIPDVEINAAMVEENRGAASDLNAVNRAVYSRRWSKVVEAGTDLSVELLEAEVSWGREAVDAEKDLESVINKLYINIKQFIDGHLSPKREIIYDHGDDDEYNKELIAAIKKVEDCLSPHLGK